jgi:DNA photolyase
MRNRNPTATRRDRYRELDHPRPANVRTVRRPTEGASPAMPSRALVWFRRDLRTADHPALLAALAAADQVVPVFVVDRTLLEGRTTGPNRRAAPSCAQPSSRWPGTWRRSEAASCSARATRSR